MANPRERRVPVWVLVSSLALALVTTGCARGCKSSLSPIHPNPNMDYQQKLEAQEESDFFYDGSGMRHPVPGTVAIGQKLEDPAFVTGMVGDGVFLADIPIEIDEHAVARGEERFGIYCSPCHDKRGNGKGVLYEYGGVPTPSFHDDQRRGYEPGRIFDIVTNGSGLMKGYRYPISTADRWAIVAHVKRLQKEKAASDLAMAR